MLSLNLPSYEFRIKTEDEKKFIFDSVRKRFIQLTPEEWVRQNFMRFLITEKKYPASLMAVEKQIILNEIPFRFDLLIYKRDGQPLLIAEFKAPSIKITQDAFDQVVRYNMALKAETIVVSNGIEHFVCNIDYQNNSYSFLKEVPNY